MSTTVATLEKTRALTEKEIKLLNANTTRICGHGYFFGGSIMKYSDGKCVATYALSHEHEARVNAKKIGEKMLELFDFIDEVEHDGIIVAKR